MWIETLIEEITAAVLTENGKLECYRGNHANVYFFAFLPSKIPVRGTTHEEW